MNQNNERDSRKNIEELETALEMLCKQNDKISKKQRNLIVIEISKLEKTL